MKRALFWLACLATPAGASEAEMPKISLQLANIPLSLELPQTPAQWQRGLQHRRQLGPNEGMLFVLDAPQYICFWMVDTWIPLSLAFVDETGMIRHIVEVEAGSDTQYCHSAKYVLELNAGWFQQHGVSTGTVIKELAP